jgi:hypothetical protein
MVLENGMIPAMALEGTGQGLILAMALEGTGEKADTSHGTGERA